MAKISVNSTIQMVTNIVILIAAILLLLFIADKYNLYSIGGQTVITTTEYLPAEEPSCTDYNIPQEYRYAYGNPAIDALEARCNGAGGVYVEQYSELSCHWNPDAFLIDCSEDPQIEFRRFCLDELKGTYVCDPSIAYFGCHCNRPIPNQWTSQEQEPEDTDSNDDGVIETTCADIVLPQYGDLGGLCRVNGEGCYIDESCEHFWSYTAGEHLCSCSETFFCGVYCHEYLYTNGCECPPFSTQEWLTRSTFVCVPEGCECFGTDIIC